MKTTTLCFLVREKEVLLAIKKQGPRGFGVGKWNGVGGKVETGESIEDGAVREIQEEIGVRVASEDLVPAGSIRFTYDGSPDWDQTMYIFLLEKWTGEPIESEEMRPEWYKQNELPFKNMWIDDPHWLPLVLTGEKIKGAFHFNATGDAILSSSLQTL